MMNDLMQCSSHGWLMVASGVLIYGVLALAGASLIKHLFFDGRRNNSASEQI